MSNKVRLLEFKIVQLLTCNTSLRALIGKGGKTDIKFL